MPRTHTSLRRLFVDDDLASGNHVPMDKNQTNYLINVLRKKPGEEVVLFNGRNGAFVAAIEPANKKSANLIVGEQIAQQTAPNDLWYGFAPLKTGRLDYMVQKATEMGVSAMQPVMTEFTQNTRLKHDKMLANVVEAAEQCEVLNIPKILPETSLAHLLAGWEENHKNRALIFADEAETATAPRDTLRECAAQRYGLLIGPEGGFSPKERELLRAQSFVIPLSLGPRILRADTAAVAALALIQSFIGDWR